MLNVKVLVWKMQNDLQMDYKRTINYLVQQMWCAKDLVREQYLGGLCLSFHLIPTLLERIEEVNPNSNTNWYKGGNIVSIEFLSYSLLFEIS